ncbi:MAG: hypothetical protein J3K34DRAFT_516801 [Monoraphidium minutum]|nr:MAG: hypothetical protein J3K34DRAFT_516801 [Monoraphidium minutum]
MAAAMDLPTSSSGEAKPTLQQRAWRRADAAMVAGGLHAKRQRDLVRHWGWTLWEQVVAIVPISLLQVVVLAVFFRKAANDPGLQAAGLISACFGLVLFLEGLRVCVMPLAEEVGRRLPQKLPLPLVMVVAFGLGVLVTYAEPAIAALRPLARLVDPNRRGAGAFAQLCGRSFAHAIGSPARLQEAPYLFVVLNQRGEAMVFAVGAGVGLAAVLGTLRFVRGWPLKPLVFGALLPTLGLSCYMQWGNPHLQPLLGLAWDLGGVTTGPVTVPILLALGIGVMRTSRQQRLATAALQSSVAANAGQALEGFGIVSLASLLPVLAVLLMGIFLSVEKSYEEVLAMAMAAAAKPPSESPADRSPAREVIFAIRSISPLIVALLLLVKLVLRVPLPHVTFWLDGGAEAAAAAASRPATPGQPRAPAALGRGGGKGATVAPAAGGEDGAAGGEDGAEAGGGGGGGKAATVEVVASGKEPADGPAAAELGDGGAAGAAAGELKGRAEGGGGAAACCGGGGGCWQRLRACLGEALPLACGVAMCQVGMILFNIGLTYGFTALGDQTGTTLPTAFLAVPYDPRSPYYSVAGGVVLLMATVFLLGVLATNAEPALNVLGATVQRLSSGMFTKRMLIGAVCAGVGVGMCAGAAKILWQLPLLYFILAKARRRRRFSVFYAVACVLTVIAEDAITAVAWDSAGVTTGPVTVPFVLSIGVGFSKAVGAAEGFGMLTIMSVAPIISVLTTALLRKPAKAVADAAARGGQAALARVSRGLERTSRSLATISFNGGLERASRGGGLERASRPLERASRGLERASRTGAALPELSRLSALGRVSRLGGGGGGGDSLARKSRSLLVYAWSKAYAAGGGGGGGGDGPSTGAAAPADAPLATPVVPGGAGGGGAGGGGGPVFEAPLAAVFEPLHENPASPADGRGGSSGGAGGAAAPRGGGVA